MKIILKVFGIAVLLTALFMLTFELWGKHLKACSTRKPVSSISAASGDGHGPWRSAC